MYSKVRLVLLGMLVFGSLVFASIAFLPASGAAAAAPQHHLPASHVVGQRATNVFAQVNRFSADHVRNAINIQTTRNVQIAINVQGVHDVLNGQNGSSGSEEADSMPDLQGYLSGNQGGMSDMDGQG